MYSVGITDEMRDRAKEYAEKADKYRVDRSGVWVDFDGESGALAEELVIEGFLEPHWPGEWSRNESWEYDFLLTLGGEAYKLDVKHRNYFAQVVKGYSQQYDSMLVRQPDGIDVDENGEVEDFDDAVEQVGEHAHLFVLTYIGRELQHGSIHGFATPEMIVSHGDPQLAENRRGWDNDAYEVPGDTLDYPPLPDDVHSRFERYPSKSVAPIPGENEAREYQESTAENTL